MIDLLHTHFFHGSECNDLTSLDPAYSDHRRPFGQAIYLSDSEATAKHYGSLASGVVDVT